MNVKRFLRQALGPALTLLVGLSLMLIEGGVVQIPNGDNLLFITVTFAGFYAGIASSLIATAIVYAIYALTVLAPGTFPPFLEELQGISIFLSLPILAVMSGMLRRRLDRVRVKEGEYQTIVDNVDAVFFLADAQANRYFYVSSAYEKVWGRPVAGLYKDPADWLKAVDPEDLTWLKKDLGESFAGVFTEIPEQRPFRIRRPDGTVRWVSSLVVSIKGPSGKVERVAGILQDRTKEVEALRELESQAKRFRQLVEFSEDAIVVSSIDGKVSYVSPAVEQHLGYTQKEFESINIFSVVHPDDLAEARSLTDRLQKVPKEAIVSQLRVRHKNGSWRWLEIISTNRLAEPEIRGVILNTHDVTEKKKAMDEAHEAEERLRQVFDNINDVFYVVALDFGKMHYVSPAYEKVWGRKVADLYANPRSWSEAIFPEDRQAVFGFLQKTLAAGSELTESDPPFRILRPDGTQRWIQSKSVPVKDPDGVIRRIVGVARDVTAQKIAEGQVKDLSELKNRFITTVSHQLRTPLSVVRWNTETLINGDVGKLKNEQKEFLRMTHAANGEVISRINDFLLALDIEEGRTYLSKGAVSIETLWRSVMHDMLKRCDLKGLACPFSAPRKSLPLIQADAEKLRVIIEKLVDNAVLYTQKGSITVKLSAAKDRVRFEIADTGIGIPEAEQPLIYHRFFRGSNASVIKTDASGLGLYIAKHFVEAHGGTIGFESEESKGSTFWFELPVK